MKENRGRELGELLRALTLLAPAEEADRRSLAALLGFGWRDPEPEPEAVPPAVAATPSAATADARRRPSGETPETTSGRRDRGPRPTPVELIPLDPRPRGEDPIWLREASPLPRPEDEARAEPPAPEPLLDRLRTRAILGEILASVQPDGPLDFEAIERRIAEAQPLVELERLPRRTLARGVEILVDRSPNLAPFYPDQELLIDRVRDLVGDGVRVLRFAGSPLAGAGAGSRRLWRPWRPPDPPRPVLVLSDLGIGRGARTRPTAPAAWLATAALAREAGCRLLVLVPYSERRWPRQLAGRLTILAWDHHLAVRQIRLATGRSRVETG